MISSEALMAFAAALGLLNWGIVFIAWFGVSRDFRAVTIAIGLATIIGIILAEPLIIFVAGLV